MIVEIVDAVDDLQAIEAELVLIRQYGTAVEERVGTRADVQHHGYTAFAGGLPQHVHGVVACKSVGFPEPFGRKYLSAAGAANAGGDDDVDTCFPRQAEEGLYDSLFLLTFSYHPGYAGGEIDDGGAVVTGIYRCGRFFGKEALFLCMQMTAP